MTTCHAAIVQPGGGAVQPRRLARDPRGPAAWDPGRRLHLAEPRAAIPAALPRDGGERARGHRPLHRRERRCRQGAASEGISRSHDRHAAGGRRSRRVLAHADATSRSTVRDRVCEAATSPRKGSTCSSTRSRASRRPASRDRRVGSRRERLVLQAHARGLGRRTTVEPWKASDAMPMAPRLDVLVLPRGPAPTGTSRSAACWWRRWRAVSRSSAPQAARSPMSSGPPAWSSRRTTSTPHRRPGDPRREYARRRKLGEAGRARVLAHYTHGRIATETIAVYRSVMEGAQAGDDRQEP